MKITASNHSSTQIIRNPRHTIHYVRSTYAKPSPSTPAAGAILRLPIDYTVGTVHNDMAVRFHASSLRDMCTTNATCLWDCKARRMGQLVGCRCACGAAGLSAERARSPGSLRRSDGACMDVGGFDRIRGRLRPAGGVEEEQIGMG